MIAIPAIDILGGKCVRLTQGDYAQVKLYNESPLEIAKDLKKQGASFLHIVDLDGAKEGAPVNQERVLEIVKTVNIPIQIGGGIRDFETAKKYLDGGVRRIILGTSAINNPELINKIIQEFGSQRLLVSLDIRNGELAINGWLEEADISLKEVVTLLQECGVRQLVVTDISSDGMLKGPNFELIKSMKREGFKIIAAGGVTTMEDLQNLKKINCEGAIIGKALYEGKINFREAAKFFNNNLAKRVIPCLDINDGRVVKGINFENLRDAGDPVELAKYYSESGADELVFLDISATFEERKTLYKLVEKIAKNIFIPFTVGGGINEMEDVQTLLLNGADKVSIGSAAVLNPELVREIAEKFGSQCVVISVDAKKSANDSGWEIFIKGGRENTGKDAIEFVREMEKLGAGELLVNSLDRDGMGTGYDIGLLKSVVESVNIPVVASSGAGKKEDFLEAVEMAKVDGVLAASLFHYGKLTVNELKKYLSENNVTIRL